MITKKKQLGPVGQFIMAVVFLGAGLGVIYLFGSDYTLICDRDQNQCFIREENVFKTDEITATMVLSDIIKAEIQEQRNSKGNSSYQVMLATNDIRIPVGEISSSSYKSANKTAQKINQYIQSSEKDLSVTQSGTIPTIFGFVFAGVGAFLVLHSLLRVIRLLLKLVFVVSSR